MEKDVQHVAIQLAYFYFLHGMICQMLVYISLYFLCLKYFKVLFKGGTLHLSSDRFLCWKESFC